MLKKVYNNVDFGCFPTRPSPSKTFLVKNKNNYLFYSEWSPPWQITLTHPLDTGVFHTEFYHSHHASTHTQFLPTQLFPTQRFHPQLFHIPHSHAPRFHIHLLYTTGPPISPLSFLPHPSPCNRQGASRCCFYHLLSRISYKNATLISSHQWHPPNPTTQWLVFYSRCPRFSPQDQCVFSGSVIDNIRYGMPSATEEEAAGR